MTDDERFEASGRLGCLPVLFIVAVSWVVCLVVGYIAYRLSSDGGRPRSVETALLKRRIRTHEHSGRSGDT